MCTNKLQRKPNRTLIKLECARRARLEIRCACPSLECGLRRETRIGVRQPARRSTYAGCRRLTAAREPHANAISHQLSALDSLHNNSIVSDQPMETQYSPPYCVPNLNDCNIVNKNLSVRRNYLLWFTL